MGELERELARLRLLATAGVPPYGIAAVRVDAGEVRHAGGDVPPEQEPVGIGPRQPERIDPVRDASVHSQGTPSEASTGGRDHLSEIRNEIKCALMWLPRVTRSCEFHEANWEYVVRVARNAIRRRDPEFALDLVDEVAEMVHELWWDTQTEAAMAERTGWGALGRAHRHAWHLYGGVRSFWGWLTRGPVGLSDVWRGLVGRPVAPDNRSGHMGAGSHFQEVPPRRGVWAWSWECLRGWIWDACLSATAIGCWLVVAYALHLAAEALLHPSRLGLLDQLRLWMEGMPVPLGPGHPGCPRYGVGWAAWENAWLQRQDWPGLWAGCRWIPDDEFGRPFGTFQQNVREAERLLELPRDQP